MDVELTPNLMLRAYASGIFPMAETRTSEDVFWVDPKRRGIMPLESFHISRSLRRTIARGFLRPSLNEAFEEVLAGCADRPETWINETIRDLYLSLHDTGFAHSLEIWEGDTLVGGVYGVTLGGAFFGESMFSRRKDASKVALAYLVDRLRNGGFTLFDTQFVTPHLISLGAIEISRSEYRRRLGESRALEADIRGPGPLPGPQLLLQRSTQTS